MILEDLWHGQIRPMEHPGHGDEDYQKLIELLERNKTNLLPTLNQVQLENFQKIEDLWEELDQIGECSAFISGFRLAVQLITASV